LKVKATLVILVLVISSACFAQTEEAEPIRGNKGNQIIGIRLGIYHFTTAEESIFGDNLVFSGAHENGFAAEFFFNYYFLDQLALEVSLANANRGDILFESDSIGRLFGSANVYPMAVGLKFTPVSGIISEKFQPYFFGGGSLVITREIFEGGTLYGPYTFYDFDSKSRTDVGWWAGGGIESYLSRKILLSSSFKYYSIEYSKYIAGYKDHSGYQITVGIGYNFKKN